MQRRLRSLLKRGRCSSGSIAVEFALVAPLFLLVLIGVVAFATLFSIASGVQQLASESARAAVAGISDAERSQIARDFVTAHVGAYPFMTAQQLSVATASTAAPAASFQVSLTYDLSRQVTAFASLLPFLPNQLHRSAVITVGTSL